MRFTSESSPKENPLDIRGPAERERIRLISGFNFALQGDIIRSITEPTGIKDPHLVDPVNTRSLHKTTVLGFYNRKNEHDYLGINFEKLLELEPDPEERKLLFWHIFNHEQIHAASSGKDGASLGYEEQGFLGIFSLWSEGVTEMVAQKVSRRFYDANGYRDKEIKSGYQIPVEFVKLVIEKIAESVGVSPKTVEEAIVSGLFLNQHYIFLNGSLNEIFEGVFPPEFLKELPFASCADMKKYIQDTKPEFFEEKLKEKDRNIFKRFFENLVKSLPKTS